MLEGKKNMTSLQVFSDLDTASAGIDIGDIGDAGGEGWGDSDLVIDEGGYSGEIVPLIAI